MTRSVREDLRVLPLIIPPPPGQSPPASGRADCAPGDQWRHRLASLLYSWYVSPAPRQRSFIRSRNVLRSTSFLLLGTQESILTGEERSLLAAIRQFDNGWGIFTLDLIIGLVDLFIAVDYRNTNRFHVFIDALGAHVEKDDQGNSWVVKGDERVPITERTVLLRARAPKSQDDPEE